MLYVNTEEAFHRFISTGFPPELENLKEMGEHFPVREKSGNFDHTGKIREFDSNTGKAWKII